MLSYFYNTWVLREFIPTGNCEHRKWKQVGAQAGSRSNQLGAFHWCFQEVASVGNVGGWHPQNLIGHSGCHPNMLNHNPKEAKFLYSDFMFETAESLIPSEDSIASYTLHSVFIPPRWSVCKVQNWDGGGVSKWFCPYSTFRDIG